jgi:[protein-PII] uridylyltransferase
VRSVEAALTGSEPTLPEPEHGRARSAAFRIAPSVAVADKASSRTTVVEINALDRPALLASLARAIRALGHQIHSAHIATYGERAVDVFYLTRSDGRKLDPEEVDRLRAALLDAAHSLPSGKADAA